MAVSTGIYNIPDHYKGDTFVGVEFQFVDDDTDTPIDLTGASVACKFRKKSVTGAEQVSLVVGSGITIVSAVNGTIKIDKFSIDWIPAIYYYDVEITFPNGDVRTYIRGTLTIKQDTTYG